MEINKQLFFSHTWTRDKLNRDNHKRVYELAKKLQMCGWSIWIDEDDMIGNIDAAMATGIDNADAIIVCLTSAYCIKINETAKNPRLRDNCLKEWTYANTRNKLMIPVIMEPCLYNITDWPPGVVSLYFGSTLYMDATNDNLNNAAININKVLQQFKLQPQEKEPTNLYSLVQAINKINNILYFEPSQRKNYLSRKNLLEYLMFKKKVFEVKKRRISEPTVLSNNKLYNLRKKWKSTGQLIGVSI